MLAVSSTTVEVSKIVAKNKENVFCFNNFLSNSFSFPPILNINLENSQLFKGYQQSK
jgi:hypothetical protein